MAFLMFNNHLKTDLQGVRKGSEVCETRASQTFERERGRRERGGGGIMKRKTFPGTVLSH